MIPKHKKVIVVHCTATRPDWWKGKSLAAQVTEVKRWHVKLNGWSDIGYAELIGRGGGVAAGRDLDKDGDVWEETAAAAKGWNKNGIHEALFGGHGGNADDNFLDHFTLKQQSKLVSRILHIQEISGREVVPLDDPADAHKLPDNQIGLIGHNQVANKACPCFYVPDWWRDQMAERAPLARVPEIPENFIAALLKHLVGVFKK